VEGCSQVGLKQVNSKTMSGRLGDKLNRLFNQARLSLMKNSYLCGKDHSMLTVHQIKKQVSWWTKYRKR